MIGITDPDIVIKEPTGPNSNSQFNKNRAKKRSDAQSNNRMDLKDDDMVMMSLDQSQDKL